MKIKIILTALFDVPQQPVLQAVRSSVGAQGLQIHYAFAEGQAWWCGVLMSMRKADGEYFYPPESALTGQGTADFALITAPEGGSVQWQFGDAPPPDAELTLELVLVAPDQYARLQRHLLRQGKRRARAVSRKSYVSPHLRQLMERTSFGAPQ
jgi:hypothetical protein